MDKFYTPSQLSENIKETPEGYLLCIGVPIARTGEMVYGKDETPLEADSEGKVLIYRDEKEVFHMDTIASFEGKPITIQHPEDFVSPDNWSYLSKGIIQNVRKSDQQDDDGNQILIADLLITDATAIQLIKNGLREVSCGYEAEYEQLEKGKGKQTRILGNHLALVEQGRAGETYAIQDHKRKNTMKDLAESMKKFFGKAVDEAMEKDKPKDEAPKKEDGKMMDQAAYDELVKMCKDLGEKVSSLMSSKEEKSKDDDEKDKEDDKSEDADEEGTKMEERIKALEAAVSKLLENKAQENSEDESSEEEKKKDKIGDSVTGLEGTKSPSIGHLPGSESKLMTAEKMNELNAAHWARK